MTNENATKREGGEEKGTVVRLEVCQQQLNGCR